VETDAIRRYTNYKWSMVLLLLGFVATMATAIAIPNYSEAVNQRLLTEGLTERGSSITKMSGPFDFVFCYIGAWHGSIDQSMWEAVNQYLMKNVGGGS